jgi:hypothetical protein
VERPHSDSDSVSYSFRLSCTDEPKAQACLGSARPLELAID